jgi:Predicted metal-dependent hydrolase of the TIM-barrel fold
MTTFTRRRWLAGLAGAGLASAQKAPVAITDYEPKSMLHVRESTVARSKFPVIDIHTHLTMVDTMVQHPKVDFLNTSPEEILPVMDRKNIRMMVNLTGGCGPALEEVIPYWHTPNPKRFLVFTQPWFGRIREAGYPKMQADEIARARKIGARGVKVLKLLGLVLRENITTGKLVKVDDPRFDLMWEAAGANKMPVAIHTSDPEAFFLPVNRFNERYEELNAHPDWSFYGKDFPSDRELQEARFRVIQRHPRTQFLVLHMGDAENLAYIAQALDRYPNMSVEFGARINELGRQPHTARRFFDKYQDRILFGTDAIPKAIDFPQQIFGDYLYEIYYRFLETEDEYFDYAPAKKPPQGRWRIYGLGLADPILRKIYQDNAVRLLGL